MRIFFYELGIYFYKLESSIKIKLLLLQKIIEKEKYIVMIIRFTGIVQALSFYEISVHYIMKTIFLFHNFTVMDVPKVHPFVKCLYGKI